MPLELLNTATGSSTSLAARESGSAGSAPPLAMPEPGGTGSASGSAGRRTVRTPIRNVLFSF
eukprot:5245124-Amphidinium_carterae.1